jgi:hypothetical protein
VTPALIETGHVLNRAVNELAYNPPGKEEGYLFYLAWYIHNGNSVLTVEDAHGVAWRGLVMFGCSTIGGLLSSNPLLGVIGTLPACPAQPPKKAKAGTPAELAERMRAPGTRPANGSAPGSEPGPAGTGAAPSGSSPAPDGSAPAPEGAP